MVKVLFVCMGNICRSPTAEGVFAKLVEKHGLQEKISLDSAGTHAYHVGEVPDARAQRAAKNRGVDLSKLKARKAISADFERFDYILAMDIHNYEILEQISPPGAEHKLSLFLDYAPGLGLREVPDPYYGGAKGFEKVLDMIEEASEGLLQTIKDQHNI